MNIAVTGATGAMGRTVLEVATERSDLTVAFGVDAEPGDGPIAGVRVYAPQELPYLLEEQHPNVLVDFSIPSATVEAVEAATDAGVASVIGTTGFDADQLEQLRAHSDRVPILKATNFARGIQALLKAVETAVEALPGYDIEVTETHHNRKRDAPSGTAGTLLERIEETRGAVDRVHGRVGSAERSPEEIGVHARRAGTIRGEHEVVFADNDEIITLSHRAESRRVFAEGALDSAVWLAGQRPGWYDFEAVVEADE